MKKISYIVVSVLEIVLLIGSYVVNYFTRKKMGMARHVVYMNQKIEAAAPIEKGIWLSAIAFTMIVVLLVLLCVTQRKKVKKIVPCMCGLAVVLTVIYVCFAVRYSTDILRAFYLICLIWAAVIVIQMLKTIIGFVVCRYEE